MYLWNGRGTQAAACNRIPLRGSPALTQFPVWLGSLGAFAESRRNLPSLFFVTLQTNQTEARS